MLATTTALGAVAAIAWPALGPAARPHATLHPSLEPIASILLNNVRVLAAPFILVAARFDRGRVSRLVGDAIVAAILVGNAIAVGVALGRWRGALIPFVPQLPVEYLAAATAATAWLNARRHAPSAPSIAATAPWRRSDWRPPRRRSRCSSPRMRDENPPTPLTPLRRLPALAAVAASPSYLDRPRRRPLPTLPITPPADDPPPHLPAARTRAPR